MTLKTPKRVLEANRRWKAKPENRERARTSNRAWRQRIKREAIDAYGGVCACCGEARLAFLSLDHPDNDGAAHRRAVNVGRNYDPSRGTGNVFYQALRKANFPKVPRLVVMCWNCNVGRRCNGGVCPHQEEREALDLPEADQDEPEP